MNYFTFIILIIYIRTLSIMNIFFLHLDPRVSVKYYFDKHCIKIILEICQMVYTAHWMTASTDDWIDTHRHDLHLEPYRKTHYNHPTSKWVRQCQSNYRYACIMGIALCEEYTHRYHKVHKSEPRLRWLLEHLPSKYMTDPIDAYLATINLPVGCTPIPLAMPAEYHSINAIHSYRKYYVQAKTHIIRSENDKSRYETVKLML